MPDTDFWSCTPAGRDQHLSQGRAARALGRHARFAHAPLSRRDRCLAAEAARFAVSEAGRGQVSSYADFSKVPVDRSEQVLPRPLGGALLRSQSRYVAA